MRKSLSLQIKLVIFSVIEGRLNFFWQNKSLPSTKLERDNSLDELASLLFEQRLGISPGKYYLEQLYTFSEEKRVVVAYFILVPSFQIPLKASQFFLETSKISSKIPDDQIITYAAQRLCWKIEYTNVVYSLLPPEFTFSELQNTYEAILGRVLDKRNFRKKILSLGILRSTGHIRKLGKARPAEMFVFKDRKLTFVEVL